jgi:uncharacterized protein YjdB
MRKRIISALLALTLLLLPLPTLAAGGSTPISISDASGLAAIANNPEGDYVLAADIDMKGVDWAPIAFRGTLDGAGHTIYNLSVTKVGADTATTYDGRHRGYKTMFAALFSIVKDGSVQNLHLLNVKVDLQTDQPVFIAGIAGYLQGGTISNCTVSGRLKVGATSRQCGAGGVVGFGYGLIQNCAVEAEITIVAVGAQGTCEEYLGGVLSNGYADVDGCSVKLDAYTSVQGYVHNGGLVGLSDVNPKNRVHHGYVRNCAVDASISFFEQVEDRRAYCKEYVGEKQNDALIVAKNMTVRFEKKESKDYATILLPDMDENPVYNAEVTEPTCTEFGYTTYINEKTGYRYTDDYTAPAHTPGDWEVVTPPTYESEGLRRQVCSVCGAVLAEETMPMQVATTSCTLNERTLHMQVGQTHPLFATVQPSDATGSVLSWSSSDDAVANVDSNGVVTAVGKGKAAIYCKTGDGLSSDACEVVVYYTFGQWIRQYILFGWMSG